MNTYMNLILEQRFFRLLSEYSQRKVSASEFTEAIEELATHVADFGINEQDYSILPVWIVLCKLNPCCSLLCC